MCHSAIAHTTAQAPQGLWFYTLGCVFSGLMQFVISRVMFAIVLTSSFVLQPCPFSSAWLLFPFFSPRYKIALLFKHLFCSCKHRASFLAVELQSCTHLSTKCSSTAMPVWIYDLCLQSSHWMCPNRAGQGFWDLSFTHLLACRWSRSTKEQKCQSSETAMSACSNSLASKEKAKAAARNLVSLQQLVGILGSSSGSMES